jgi:hypothetical protein
LTSHVIPGKTLSNEDTAHPAVGVRDGTFVPYKDGQHATQTYPSTLSTKTLVCETAMGHLNLLLGVNMTAKGQCHKRVAARAAVRQASSPACKQPINHTLTSRVTTWDSRYTLLSLGRAACHTDKDTAVEVNGTRQQLLTTDGYENEQ